MAPGSGDFEEVVAREIDPLREAGWTVVHNVIGDDGGGNVDYFESAPGGVAFAIETKSGRFCAADRGQAISNAIWAKGKFAVRFASALPIGCDRLPPSVPAGDQGLEPLRLGRLAGGRERGRPATVCPAHWASSGGSDH
jgi:hypothetical protein